MENNNKLDRLKQFIINEYAKEQLNPIITLDFKISVAINLFDFSFFNKCPNNAFLDKYSYLNGMSGWFNKWINNEFPNKKIKIYINDEPNSDLFVKVE